HEVPVEEVHLHEAVDCVVDAVATALALNDLGHIDGIVKATPMGVGDIAPATMHIIVSQEIPVTHFSGREVATPTGAAIAAAIVDEYTTAIPTGAKGNGAGTMKCPYPNIVSAIIPTDKYILETNIDDCTPEQVTYTMEKLITDHALDVHVMPCLMKKGRLGFLIRVLTEHPERHSKAMMRETGTLGVRVDKVGKRVEAARELGKMALDVDGQLMQVGIKRSEYCLKPEYDDVAEAARKSGKPFREIQAKARRKAGR
ncbi:nickel insertion protein, partial [Candidatus Altiarchaeota archaeon]